MNHPSAAVTAAVMMAAGMGWSLPGSGRCARREALQEKLSQPSPDPLYDVAIAQAALKAQAKSKKSRAKRKG